MAGSTRHRLLGTAMLVLAAVPAASSALLVLVLLRPADLVGCALAGALAGMASYAVVEGWARSDRRSGSWAGWAARVGSCTGTGLWGSGLYGALLVLVTAGNVAFLGAGAGLGLTGLLVAVVVASWVLRSGPATAGSGEPAVTTTITADPPAPADVSPPPRPDEPRPDEPALVAALRSWSDDAVCRAWRCSYVRLERSGGHGLERIAHERRAYLDELERRHPAGFQAWINSGARAPSDPSRYLTAPRLTARPARRPTSPSTDPHEPS